MIDGSAVAGALFFGAILLLAIGFGLAYLIQWIF